MRRSPIQTALFVAILTTTACHKMYVRAEVTADEAPLEDAAVAMWCPQVPPMRGPAIFGRTNEYGLLDHHELPGGAWLHENCEIVVINEGFERARYPVPDVCERWKAGYRCQTVRVRADLQRAHPQ